MSPSTQSDPDPWPFLNRLACTICTNALDEGRAWRTSYNGTAHCALSHHVDKNSNPDVYLRLYPIIGPSGIGKSRVVDQFSCENFVIPLNFSNREHAFPPPDLDLKKWIDEETYKLAVVKLTDKPTVELDWYRIDVFFRILLIAILRTTKEVIEEGIRNVIEKEPRLDAAEKEILLANFPTALAAQFHTYMTVGQGTRRPGALRTVFYERVMQKANPLCHNLHVILNSVGAKRDSIRDQFRGYQKPVQDSAQGLFCSLAEASAGEGSSKKVQQITFAIDGAEEFQTFKQCSNGDPWSQMFGFIRAFRALHRMPVNCFVIARTWSLFGPPKGDIDPSDRWYYGYKTIAPFCSIGFDGLVGEDRFVGDGSWTLDKVTKEEFWVKLGRPSWGLRHIQVPEKGRAHLLHHVIDELLDGSRMYQYAMSCLDEEERLAILSPRLGLEFKPTPRPFLAYPGDSELTQVQKHLRAMLHMEPMSYIRPTLTISPSEPTVVEAASRLMRRKDFDTPIALRSILLWQARYLISRGFRGEIVLASVLLDTLDNCSFDRAGRRTRFIVPVWEFMEALLPQDALTQVIHSSRFCANGNPTSKFAEMFRGSTMYVTHFVRALDFGVLRRDILMRYIVRGAGIICSSKEGHIDLVLPFLYSGNRLTMTNVSAVLVRIQDTIANDDTSHLAVIDEMDPYTLGVFPQEEALPIIRILVDVSYMKVQARQTDTSNAEPPSQVVLHHRCPYDSSERQGNQSLLPYTSLDVSCRGVSSKTFRAIEPDRDSIYTKMLELILLDDTRDRLEEDEDYVLRADMLSSSAMTMWPGATSQDESWSSFVQI
ncbi:hypothetical protein CERSUDRAFT_92862 [Gelatoporia subvermispora B]|uniref:Uncharacterized protein n=1 Tax=Ceriporiopsis subvermispora (strain B) TaxID=914234 RepID=M2PQJ9_CERS8|nr:hypothetical protein CERSUDRAFT_92862 [Gelatoporia subvermispora B]